MADYVGDVSTGSIETATTVAQLMGHVVQARGKKYIYARAGEALTKNTPYSIQCEGLAGTSTATTDPAVKALLNTAVKQLVVVPTFRTLADNDTGWFQFQGLVSGMVVGSATWVAGRTLKVTAAAVTEIAAAPTNADIEFGTVAVGVTSGTAIDAFLFGRETLSET